MTALVEGRGLTKRFRRADRTVDALVDIDLSVSAGEILLLTGPALSGKTTLIHLLAGFMSPEAGTVRWLGRPEHPPWSTLTVVTQELTLIEELTVRENVEFASRVGHSSLDPDHVSRLSRLGLAPLLRRLPSEISVGERQRVMVARALVGRPSVVLADDPIAYQDEEHADAVVSALQAARDHGAACIIAARMDSPLRRLGAREQSLPPQAR